MNHPKDDEMQEFADGFCEEQVRSQIESHILTCAECKERVEGLIKLSSVIRRVSLERVPDTFTDRVMRKIGAGESSSFLWFLLKNIAPVIGLFIIVGIVYFGLTFTGIIGTSDVDQSNSTINNMLDKFSGDITSATSAFGGWLKRVFPFLYTEGSYSIIIVMIVLALGAIFDRFILIPIFRRRG
jgi:hypothetical protein